MILGRTISVVATHQLQREKLAVFRTGFPALETQIVTRRKVGEEAGWWLGSGCCLYRKTCTGHRARSRLCAHNSYCFDQQSRHVVKPWSPRWLYLGKKDLVRRLLILEDPVVED